MTVFCYVQFNDLTVLGTSFNQAEKGFRPLKLTFMAY